MENIFPFPVRNLPQVDIPLKGVTAYLSQAIDHQIIFMQFSENIELPVHSHESQWGIVLEGRIDLNIGGELKSYAKGDRYFIPAGVEHSGKIFAGYTDITFFNEPKRYKTK